MGNSCCGCLGHELHMFVVDDTIAAVTSQEDHRRLPFSPQTVRVSHTNHRERLSSDDKTNLGVV